jgi:hypothetical protein
MAIKFNHVTNTISFTSGACSASFVDSSATGIFETTGYARNCFVNTGQTGSLNYVKCPSSPSAGCVICYDGSNWVAGTSAGGGGGGTTLPNGSTENSALCWDGSAWTTGQTYVATGQTGNFNPFISDTVNCNLNYKYDLNTVSNSTGSAVFQGNNNLITGQLNSQINNGSFNCITQLGCFNYIENGFTNCIFSGSCFSEILNGARNSISGGFYSSILNGSGNLIRGGSAMTIVNSLTSSICGIGTFSATILGGCCNGVNLSSRSSVIGGQNNFICSASVDAVVNGGRGNIINGASLSVIVGGSCNRLCHSSSFVQSGNIIIGGESSRIGGCFNTNNNTIINSCCGCICSGSFNTLINGTNSCLMTGALSSTIIGPRNTICNLIGAVVIGSGITANANNTLFVNNLCAFGSIAGTGSFVTTGQTGSFAYVKCPSSPTAGCVICYDGTNWVAGTSAGGGTALPNGTSANSALCWNGSAWVAAQTAETTGYARSNYLTTGNGYLAVKTVAENMFVTSSGATSSINFDLISGSSLYYAGDATSNFTLNLRGSSACTLSNLVPAFNSISATFIYNVGLTAYCLTGVYIDGNLCTVKWAGGGGNPSPELSAVNMYSIVAIRTGVSSSHWSLIGSLGFYS